MPKVVADYLELAKARLCMMVLITTTVGYVVARPAAPLGWPLVWTLLGTALTAFGANALNQLLEKERDAKMERTRLRPLPDGRIGDRAALLFGLGSALAGVGVLAWLVGWLPAALAVGTILLYVLVYTPLKPVSSLNTVVGAVTGAVPPMIGWAAATGRLDTGAYLLGALLFIWQFPHFFALSWLYRADYARGGFCMLPLLDPQGQLTFRVLVAFTFLLLPLGLVIFSSGVAGPWFAVGSLALGLWWLAFGAALLRSGTDRAARRVFLASLVYLPALLGLMVVDRGPAARGGTAQVFAVAAAEASPETPPKAATP
jgi:protoheme IX farnesyltransferase